LIFSLAIDRPLSNLVPVTITEKARWELVCVRRGVPVYRRKNHSGTCGGQWLAHDLFKTKKQAFAWIDSLSEGLFLSPSITIKSP
jgi:hypothetical protein